MVCKRMPWGQGTKWRAPGRMVGGVAAWGGGWHIVQMTSVPLESPGTGGRSSTSRAKAIGKCSGSAKAKKGSWGREGSVSGRRRQKLKGPRLTLPSSKRVYVYIIRTTQGAGHTDGQTDSTAVQQVHRSRVGSPTVPYPYTPSVLQARLRLPPLPGLPPPPPPPRRRRRAASSGGWRRRPRAGRRW